MSKDVRYTKESRKVKKEKSQREARAFEVMERVRESGRSPVPPPGFFHDTDGRPGRKDRSATKGKLRNIRKEFNHG